MSAKTPATTAAPTTTSAPAAAPVAPAAAAAPAATPAAVAAAPAAPAAVESLLVEAKPAETKPAEAPAAATEAELDLKFADGVKLDDASLKSFKATAKELGLDSPKAQKLVDLYAGMEASRATAQEAQFKSIDKGWQEQISADPELGGQNLEATKKFARTAFAKWDASGEARQLITQLGVGNHPALVKLFAAIGKATADDRVGGSASPAGGSADSEASILKALYPSMNHPA